MSESAKAQWRDSEYRRYMSDCVKRQRQDEESEPATPARLRGVVQRADRGRVRRIQ